MSLINEALKKAQRARHEGAAASPAGADDGGIVKRAQPRKATTTLLFALGALVLVALSIAVTAYWVSQPTETHVATAKPQPAAETTTPAETTAAAPSVSFTAPAAAPATPVQPKDQHATTVAVQPPAPATPSPAPTVEAPAPARAKEPDTAVPAAQAPQPATASTEAAAPEPAPAPASPPPVPDERVHKVVEALRVMGIRSSGTDSKVLMNDRVFRVNDIVDRALNVRLTKVAPDHLEFTDANGATYVKYF